jgi:hypothetical protein
LATSEYAALVADTYEELKVNNTSPTINALFGIVRESDIPTFWWATLSPLLLAIAIFWPIYIRQRTRRKRFRIEGVLLPRLVVTMHHLDFVKDVSNDQVSAEEDDSDDSEDSDEVDTDADAEGEGESANLKQNQNDKSPILVIGTVAQFTTDTVFPDKVCTMYALHLFAKLPATHNTAICIFIN